MTVHSVLEQRQVPEAASLLDTLRTMTDAVRKNVCTGKSERAEKAMREHLFGLVDALRRLAESGPSPLTPPTARG